MKKSELVKLKRCFHFELERAKRIKELASEDSVKEFIRLLNINMKKLNNLDHYKILKNVLGNFQFNETNGIYVCIGTYGEYWVSSWDENYLEDIYEVDFDSKDAELRTYFDIENGKEVTRHIYRQEESALEFERNNIVLNPYNSNENLNGYEEVRMNFFMNAIKYGEKKSKELILEKYSRI